MRHTRYTIITPPPSRAADRPPQIDEALVAEVRAVLQAALATLPLTASTGRHASREMFAGPMMSLCAACRARGVTVEKLIIALKQAWSTLAAQRLRLGDGDSDALAGAVSACIETYFEADGLRRVE